MPPLGQFNVKDSAKDSKKRRGGPGAPGTLGSVPGPSTVDAARMTDAQARAQGLQVGNVNKVSELLFSLFYVEWSRSMVVLFMNGLNGVLLSHRVIHREIRHPTSELNLQRDIFSATTYVPRCDTSSNRLDLFLHYLQKLAIQHIHLAGKVRSSEISNAASSFSFSASPS